MTHPADLGQCSGITLAGSRSGTPPTPVPARVTVADWDAHGPNGERRHCHRYFVGGTAYTNCN
jgi:hypothetical protein